MQRANLDNIPKDRTHMFANLYYKIICIIILLVAGIFLVPVIYLLYLQLKKFASRRLGHGHHFRNTNNKVE
jgi:hypothetical protein